MRTFEAVTTFGPEGFEEYGRRMVRSWCKFWPVDVELHIYADRFERDLPKWQSEFVSRFGGKPSARGINGPRYNFRCDAIKFSHKVAAIVDAYEQCKSDVLIWIDADTITHSPVTMEFVDGLMPETAQVAWLDRSMLYPECGFVVYRANDPQLTKLFAEFRKLYETGEIFSLQEWHDSWLFEHLVKKHKIKTHSLSGETGRDTHHPAINGPLGAILDHTKGPRKAAGRSRPKDLRVARSEAHWR